MHRPLALLVATTLLACTPAAPPPAAGSTTPPPVQVAEPAPPIHFVENDLAAALARARAEKKILFVDAWAPWCHTCLSMQHFVLGDPSLRPLGERVLFASIDTDRPENAPFLERHPIKALPTFFLLDPEGERVLGFWIGSASVNEMRAVIEESLREKAGTSTDPASRAFAEARVAHAAGKLEAAQAAYRRALDLSAPSWPNRSPSILGLLETLSGAKAWKECVDTGLRHFPEVTGAVMPADASSYLLGCADHLPDGPARADAEALALRRLRQICENPPEGATIDDRADALDILSGALASKSDAAGAKAAQEKRLTLMEQAARAAKTPEEAQTFDYGRANAYLALDRADEAIRMLEQREKELPGSYEPPARLASVLNKTGKLPEALRAVDRALSRAYGPRRLRYLALRASILQKSGDTVGATAALREEIKGYEALPPGQSSPESLADARRRLAEAEKSSAPVSY